MENYNPLVMINHERAAAVNSNARDAEEFIRNLPPGYRFYPTDEELVVDYLMKKVNNEPLPIDIMPVVEINQQSPDELAGIKSNESKDGCYICSATHGPAGDGVWYFFTALDRKYKNGARPSRTSSDHGYWKPTGADKTICSGDLVVGYKKTLDYYTGKQKEGNSSKSGWKMHEYRIKEKSLPPPAEGSANNMKLDGIFLCKIYKNGRGKKDDQDGASTTNSLDTNSPENKKPEEDPAPAAQPNNAIPRSNPAPESSNTTNNGSSSSSVRVGALFFHRSHFLRPHNYTDHDDQRFMINEVIPSGSNMQPLTPMGLHLTTMCGSTNYNANAQLVKNAETRNEAPLMRASSTDQWRQLPQGSLFFDSGDDFQSISTDELHKMFDEMGDDDASGQNKQKKM